MGFCSGHKKVVVIIKRGRRINGVVVWRASSVIILQLLSIVEYVIDASCDTVYIDSSILLMYRCVLSLIAVTRMPAQFSCTVPPKCKLTLDSRFSRESRIEDRVSILDSILDTRFSQKLSTRNFPDYADSMQVARKQFISCKERTITAIHDCRSTYNPSRANVLTTARA